MTRQVKPQGGRLGGTVEKEASLHISNVSLYDAKRPARPSRSVGVSSTGRKVAHQSEDRRRHRQGIGDCNATAFEDPVQRDRSPSSPEGVCYKNIMEVPKLEKIVVNTSIKEAITNMKILDSAAEIGLITGQKAHHRPRSAFHRELQASRGHASGCEGDTAFVHDVGVP